MKSLDENRLQRVSATSLLVWSACLGLLSFAVACGESEPSDRGPDAEQDVAEEVSPDPDDVTDTSTEVDTQPEPERDAAVVGEALDRASVQAYREAVLVGAGQTSCAAEQPAGGDTCADDAACDDGSVCRNTRVRGLDSRCSCAPASPCDDLTCATSQTCLPGTESAQTLCGGGLNTVLCAATCVPGRCASDDDCNADERCIVVRNECRRLQGVACTPAEGSGCLGLEDACGAEEACLPNRSGEWVCVSTVVACD